MLAGRPGRARRVGDESVPVYIGPYQLPTQVSILERTDTLDGDEILPGFRLPIV
jgi:hypothetical protein